MCNKIHYGYTSSAAEYGNIKLLRITDIQHNFVDWDSVPYCEQNPVDLDSFALETNDILIARTGGTIGKSFLIKEKLDHIAVFASYLIRVVPSKLLDSNYIKVFLGTSFYWQLLTLKSMGIGQPNVNGESLKTLLIPLPPITEENNISTKVDNLEFFIKNSYISYNNISERIALAKSKLLELAIRGKLLPQDPNDEPASDLLKRIREEKRKVSAVGKSKKAKPESYIFKGDDNLYYEQIGSETRCIQDEIPFEIPENWIWYRLEDSCSIISTKNNQIKESEILKEGTIPVITQSAKFIEGFFNKTEKTLKVTNPLVLFGDHTLNVKYVDFDFLVGADGVKILESKFQNSIFFYYSILWGTSLIRNRGYSRHFQFLKKLFFPLPPLEEQKRIVDFITRTSEQLDSMLNK